MSVDFVKFQRGTQAVYDRIKANKSLDDNTLYFIYDKNNPENGGLLYLGETLIGGTGVTGAKELKDLEDLNLSSTLNDGMILLYNGLTKKWTSTSFQEAIRHTGAMTIAVKSGEQSEGQSVEEALQSINGDPASGDITFLDGTAYIYDGFNWKILIGESLEDRIVALETGLQAVDGKIATVISNSNHLTYVVKNELPVISQLTVAELQDLQNKVILVSELNPVTNNNAFSEYLLVNNQFEKLGNFNDVILDNYVQVGDLNNYLTKAEFQAVSSNYVTQVEFNKKVGNLNDLKTAVNKEDTNIVDEIIEIHNRLTWNDISE